MRPSQADGCPTESVIAAKSESEARASPPMNRRLDPFSLQCLQGLCCRVCQQGEHDESWIRIRFQLGHRRLQRLLLPPTDHIDVKPVAHLAIGTKALDNAGG